MQESLRPPLIFKTKESKDFMRPPIFPTIIYWVFLFRYLSHLPGQADNNVGVTSCLVSACVAAEGAAVISVDIEFKCCLIAFRQAFIILDASMDRHCQKSAWCQLYSSISNLTSVTNEVRYCVFCGNKTSQYIECSARPHCSSQPPAKYFISEPLDGSVSVKLFSFERRITMPARQQTNKNLK